MENVDDSPFLDRREEIKTFEGGNLPHWNQNNKIQFVTFRLYDSVPQEIVKDFVCRRDSFLKLNPRPWSEEIAKQYQETFGEEFDSLLDNGYGECLLKDYRLRRIVEQSLAYFDNVRYRLIAYVIMPNHIHILLQINGEENLSSILHSIKSYTSHRINRERNSTGEIWQKEYHDRLIRNRTHLEYCVSYILRNPAHLQPGDFSVYVNREYLSGL